MLTQFKIEKHFNKLHVALHVERRGRETLASLCLTHNRRIVFNQDIRPADAYHVATPELANAWLSEVVTEHGSRVETWEHRYKLQPAA